LTTKQLSINIDGLRSGLLGNAPMDAEYMAGVRARARMLSKACSVKRIVNNSQADHYVRILKK